MALPLNPVLERRAPQKEDILPDKRHYQDREEGTRIVKIIVGEWYVSSAENEMITTILGSCVSACIRDPYIKAGGMNHFLLPGNDSMDSQLGDAARYGVFAMENLINGVLKAGGNRRMLEVKVFGGGNVINNSARIGSKNAEFIRNFLHKEGFRIVSEDLEGDYPRRVHYYPATGKVMIRKLMRKDDMAVVAEEENYKQQIIHQPVEGSIDLF